LEHPIPNNIHNPSIKATPELQKKLKAGIYRELHRKGLLTKEQLSYLLGLQNIGAGFNVEF